MQEGVTETQRAVRLAAAMEAFQASNKGRLGGEAAPGTDMETPAVATERPVAERLKELAALLEQGLITEVEYQEKRQGILSGI